MPNADRWAIYGRYSSSNQDKGVSIETQLESCRRITNGDPLIFIDRAVTGRTMHREGFIKMLAAAEAGAFDKLVVYKWDRFGRNSLTHSVISDLEDLGIAVTSATEGSDFLARGVGLLVSEDFSKKLSQRVKDAMHVRFKQNHSHLGGSVTYGYQLERGSDGLNRMVIDEQEAVIVRRVFELYRTESMGAKKISRRLDEEGYKPRTSKLWGWTTINRMLKNEQYLGILFYGKQSEKTDKKSGKVTHIKNATFQTFKVPSLRIISDKDFAAVQKRMKAGSHGEYPRLPRNLRVLSRLAWCGTCGNVMFTRHTSNQNPIVHHYLVCGRRDRHGIDEKGCINSHRPREKALIEIFQEGIRKVLGDRDRIIKRAMELATAQLDTQTIQRVGLEKELSKVHSTIERFGKLMGDPSLSDMEVRGYSSRIGSLELERDEINRTIQQLATAGVVDMKAVVREVEAAMVEAEHSILDVATPQVVNRAIDRFCGPIIVFDDGTIGPREADFVPALPPVPVVTKSPVGIEVCRRR
jgi:site-specific DNA recombinase